MTNNNISALILAGGKSSRMGKDKALIKVDGQPLLQRTCEVALQCADSVFVITPWGEKYRQIVPPKCQIIHEKLTEFHGPLVAFSQGLIHLQTAWVLLLACDLPFLNAKEIKAWLSYLPQVEAQALAFLAQNSKGWEPLCGFYRRSCLPLLQEFITQGGRSFQKWLTFHPVEVLPVQNPQVLFNCNTPEDLQQLSPLKY
jgi:molybdopterin-guanine dinucleotide biosynthesis protein A